MAQPKPRVAVGIEPYLSRSALHAFLALDGRFDPVLLPLGEDPVEEATRVGADLLILSHPVDAPNLLVVVLSGSPLSVELRSGDSSRGRAYEGLDALADALLVELAASPQHALGERRTGRLPEAG